MLQLRRLLMIIVLGLAATLRAQDERSPMSASGRGAIIGSIAASSGQLPQIVVYLQPLDPTVAVAAPDRVEVISQKGATFSPSLLVIAAGQTVEFRNDEDRPIEHNVFSRSPAKPFDLGLYPPPQAKRVTFTDAGPVQLFCSIHRYMDGVIYVCPTPLFAIVQPDGSFRIDDIPAGEWRLRTWQRGARFNDIDDVVRIEPSKQRAVRLEMKRG